MSKFKQWMAVVLLPLTLLAMPVSAEVTAPVAKLQNIEGVVEYSKNGKRWKRVTRNKYLFPGYIVRTEDDSSATVLNQSSGETQNLAERSEVRITNKGLELVRGRLGEPEEEVSSFWQALVNKFSTAQRYTTVRRSVIKKCTVDTPRKLTVSEDYREVVWRNAGPDCSYRVTVAGEVHEVPVASTAEMIRFRLGTLPAGEHELLVEVVQGGEVVYVQKRPTKLTWVEGAELAALQQKEQDIRAQTGNDEIVLASFMEDAGLLVPAMDMYRGYMMANPDDNDMRPLLIKAYNNLKLVDLKNKEATAYQAELMAEEEADAAG